MLRFEIPSAKTLIFIVYALMMLATLSSAAMERENRGKEMSPPSWMKRNDDTSFSPPEQFHPQRQLYFYPRIDDRQAFFGRQAISLSDILGLNEFPNYG